MFDAGLLKMQTTRRLQPSGRTAGAALSFWKEGPCMATMISEVYDAVIASGAPEDKARKAAEAIAAFESRFNKIENELHLLKWMNGITWALSLAILFRVFLR
jgi:hypothetical protein